MQVVATITGHYSTLTPSDGNAMHLANANTFELQYTCSDRHEFSTHSHYSIGTLGSGSDYAPFLQVVGISAADFTYTYDVVRTLVIPYNPVKSKLRCSLQQERILLDATYY